MPSTNLAANVLVPIIGCDAAFPDAYSSPNVTCHPKAPSPLRFAGALHKAFTSNATVRNNPAF
jgi:hypothetical protein